MTEQVKSDERQRADPISALERVRKGEAEAIALRAEAEDRAGAVVQEALRQAESIRGQAEEVAERAAEERYQSVLAEARAQAERIVEEAHAQARPLRRRAQERREELVQRAVEFVLGPGQEPS